MKKNSKLILYLFCNNKTFSLNSFFISKPTDGNFPEPRRLHSAVVTPDARIIIYGGITLRLLEHLKQAAPLRLNDRFPKTSIAILDTSRKPFFWSIPQLTGDSLRPALLHGHTATMVGNVMIVAFGSRF